MHITFPKNHNMCYSHLMNANYCNANVQVVQYVVVMEGRWMVCLSLDAKYVKYILQSIKINRQYGYPETSRNRPKFAKRKSHFQFLCLVPLWVCVSFWQFNSFNHPTFVHAQHFLMCTMVLAITVIQSTFSKVPEIVYCFFFSLIPTDVYRVDKVSHSFTHTPTIVNSN